MNKERIEQLAVAIESHAIAGLGFNMGFFRFTGGAADASGHNCGTVACIAGWATALGKLSGTFVDAADNWLDISYDKVGQELFFPGNASGIRVRDWSLITPAHAAGVLRRLAETGRVDWAAVLPEAMIEREDEERRRMNMLFPIVGSHFVPPAKALLEHAPQGAAICVRPERDNPYDGNAITVHITFGEIPHSQWDELRLKMAGYGFDLDDCDESTEFPLGHIAASGGKPIGKIEMTTGLSLAGTIELAALAGAEWSELAGTLQFANEGVPLVEIDYAEGENE